MAANAQDVKTDQGDLKAMLAAIVQELDREAEERVMKRTLIEQRWLEDLRQFHGRYDEKTISELQIAKKSQLFINQTRPKTNAMEARLSDMLFPTDDRNWGIGPTPVPELTVQAEQVARQAAEAELALTEDPNNPQLQSVAAQAQQESALVEQRLQVARDRAQSMQEEIDDVLRECQYSIQARDVIRDACRIGTGVFKGPITDGRARRGWRQNPQNNNVFELYRENEEKPVLTRVDPWNFFPDMDVATLEDGEGNFERHLFNSKQLRRLAQRPGFDKDAIRTLLRDGARGAPPSYYADLRTLTGGYPDIGKDRFHVWEYHGPLSAQNVERVALAMGQDKYLEDIPDNVDPLKEIQVTIWFCQGLALKFALHHLDSEDVIYSVFSLEKDESCVFGYGVPYIMRDPQSAYAATWRTILDNMGLSSGPQIVINEQAIEPVNGVWALEPRKVWRRKSTAPKDMKPFETFDIPSHLEQLSAVLELSRRTIDEETALPMLAQGEQGAQVTKTFQGMAILMNSVNVVFRRIVKNWDDDVTVPNITRTYDWLMQFSRKESIKGDYQVDARGTSTLLVREMQSQNLMMFLANFSGHPLLGKYLKEEGLPALRSLARTLLLPADEIIKGRAEIAKDEAEAAGKPPRPDPEMEKIAASLNLEKMRGDNALELESMKRETAMIELAAKSNMNLDTLRAHLMEKDAEHAHDERMMVTEAAIESRENEKDRQTEAANGKDGDGSGGYFSQ